MEGLLGQECHMACLPERSRPSRRKDRLEKQVVHPSADVVHAAQRGPTAVWWELGEVFQAGEEALGWLSGPGCMFCALRRTQDAEREGVTRAQP